jgi:curved DNA-binding protein CbpA
MAVEYEPKADYYAVLGINVNATAADIKKAHRVRIRDLHPDRGGDATRAPTVNIARDVLVDPNTRRAYDQARHAWITEVMRDPFMRAFAGAGRTAQHAHATPHASAAESHQGNTAAPSESARAHTTSTEKQDRGWRWGVVSEYAWNDIWKVFRSGNWLGAVGSFGTALFVDHAIQQSADPEQLAKLDAALAAKRRERATELLQAIASQFGLEGAEVTAGAGTAARNAASRTARVRTSRRRGTRRRNGAPGAGAARARSR